MPLDWVLRLFDYSRVAVEFVDQVPDYFAAMGHVNFIQGLNPFLLSYLSEHIH